MPTPSGQTSDESDSELEAVLAEVARPPSLDTALLAQVMPAIGAVDGADRRASTNRAELKDGDLVDGRYRVLCRLGHGGMGVVYAAENLRTKKQVALKCMSLHGSSSSARAALLAARFRREARAAASIRHANVVDVYDAGGSVEAPYLVMELLHGEALRERMARGAVPWPEARDIFLAVLAGVKAAHQAGIIHRDLKPDNIFLSREPHAPALVPKVLDFGIAAVRAGTSEELDALTRTGTVLGTPSYMAPEQLTAGEVDTRTDVYALGVVLYEMLSGHLPFVARSASALAVLQATEAPTALSHHRPELAGQVESVLMRALARRPEDRYQSVDELAAAIAQCTGNAKANGRRRKWLLALAGVLVVLLARGAASFDTAGALGAYRSTPARERAREKPQRHPAAVTLAPPAEAASDAGVMPRKAELPVPGTEDPPTKALKQRTRLPRAPQPKQVQKTPLDLSAEDF